MITGQILVAPHAGALVETRTGRFDFYWPAVAPHAGALVETPDMYEALLAAESRLTQAR